MIITTMNDLRRVAAGIELTPMLLAVELMPARSRHCAAHAGQLERSRSRSATRSRLDRVQLVFRDAQVAQRLLPVGVRPHVDD
jgi:hypothetical protein